MNSYNTPDKTPKTPEAQVDTTTKITDAETPNLNEVTGENYSEDIADILGL